MAIEIRDPEPRTLKKPSDKNVLGITKASHVQEKKIREEFELWKAEGKKVLSYLMGQLPTLQRDMMLDRSKWDKLMSARPEMQYKLQYLFNDISPAWAWLWDLKQQKKISATMEKTKDCYMVKICALANGIAIEPGIQITINPPQYRKMPTKE